MRPGPANASRGAGCGGTRVYSANWRGWQGGGKRLRALPYLRFDLGYQFHAGQPGKVCVTGNQCRMMSARCRINDCIGG